MSALSRAAARAEVDRQVSDALVEFYRNATALVREILDVGNDRKELEAKAQSLREEIARVETRVRDLVAADGEPAAGGQDPDLAAVVNAARSVS